jgi:hypothetical protein
MLLPMELWAQLAIVADEGRPRAVRLRALAVLERNARDHRKDVARELVALLASPPDIAAPVHVGLLVLDPDLRVARLDVDGVPAFVAIDDPHAPRLDELHRLFGPADELPAFLTPPDRAAPMPYRPPPDVLALRRIEDEERARRTQWRERLQQLGLDHDDLDDDAPPPRVAFVPRRDAPHLGDVDEGEAVVVACAGRVIDIGVAHGGAWWADERRGDHRGAHRLHVRLDRNDAAPSNADGANGAIVRRERSLPLREANIEIALGVHRVAKSIAGRGVVVFVEEQRDLVVGVTVSWSAWTAFPTPKKTEPATLVTGSRRRA